MKANMPNTGPFALQSAAGDGGSFTVKNNTVSCSVYMPSSEGYAASACFNIMDGLADELFVIPFGKVLSWMRWRARTVQDCERPYAFADGLNASIYRHMGSPTFEMKASTVLDWDWVLLKLWQLFLRSCRHYLVPRGYHLFERWQKMDALALMTVSPDLWSTMLEFSGAFGVEHGNTEWHIFANSRSCLQVVECVSASGITRGFDATLFARRPSSTWPETTDNWTVTWPFNPARSAGRCEIPRKSENARYIHDWLLKSFLPEVLRWRCRRKRRFFFLPLKRPDMASFAPSSYGATSCVYPSEPPIADFEGSVRQLSDYQEDLFVRHFEHL